MKQGKRALQKEREALQEFCIALSAAKQGDRTSAICQHEIFIALQTEANMLRRTDEKPVIGAGGEVFSSSIDDESAESILAVETLLHPDAVNIGASAERLTLLEKADVSELGVDAAESIKASNSLEKMLAHQLAACHMMAMKMTEQSSEQHDPVEIVRLSNASARMMKAYQEGLLALNKIRVGGRQTVVVQHVRVTDGGQAVVAGTVKGKGASDGG